VYPQEIVIPCREELTGIGVEELKTPDEVEDVLSRQKGTVMLVINSVCGCAAGSARPGVRLALQHTVVPDRVTAVFAGVDTEATARAREFMEGFPPSSPSVAIFKNGDLVYLMERHMIEGREPDEIARELKGAFDRHCAKTV
jgi:putative YphP/YqiW family bacilliredoxin